MGEAKRRGTFEERRSTAEARIMTKGAHGAARNMIDQTATEDYEVAERSDTRSAGCSPISEGCARCYAAAVSLRFGLPWGGPCFIAGRLEQPAKVRKPSRIFCGSMTDLFHEGVRDWWLDEVMRVITENKRHTFIVLAKRPERMRRYFCNGVPGNLWLGVTAENQRRLNERMFHLLETPAAVRFVSVEPMLERVHIGAPWLEGLRWVIAGPETGPGARECRAEWIMDLADECADAEVAFFDKRKAGWLLREFPD